MKEINSFEELLTKTGKVNTAIIRHKDFKLMPIYQKIFEMSHELDKFDNIKLSERILFLTKQCKIGICPKCGKEYYVFKRSQNVYRQCSHNFNVKIDLSSLRKNIFEKKKISLLNSVDEHVDLLLSKDDFDDVMEQMFNKPDNYAFSITENNKDFFHDVLLKTKDVLKIDENDLQMSQRLYIIKNEIKKIPLCRYCSNEVAFINRKSGYRTVCSSNDCVSKLGLLKRIDSHRRFVDSAIDHDKYEIIGYPDILNNDSLKIRCRKCGYESEYLMNNGRLGNLMNMPLCKNCEYSISTGEEELVNFIKSIYDGNVIHGINGRKTIPPYELDVFLPDKNIAFEYDGLYYHSSISGKNSDYHLMKMEMCKSKGIRLIHIFEDEWLMKADIVKSRIKNILRICNMRIFARQCSVRELKSNESNKFLDANHIQGHSNTHINIGLFFKDELVSVMTFGKSRFSRKYEYELLRYASKINTMVIGGASKLLKYFERTFKPKSMVSYADLRWSCGNLYYNLGFKLHHISKPNYYYTDFNIRYSRIRFQKHKLKDILKNYDEKCTEEHNMNMNGYYRIYDCGNMVFVKEY